MAHEIEPMDVSALPELLRIAEEVGRSGEARMLRRNGEDLAVVIPAGKRSSRARKPKSHEDLEAFRAAAGTWADADTAKLVEDIYESRRSSRPPVDL
jgi:hypothetical protein